MGFGVSLILAAIGAVLIWAVDASVSGVNIHVVGWILLIVGAIGFLLSLVFLDSFRNRRRYVDDVDDPRL